MIRSILKPGLMAAASVSAITLVGCAGPPAPIPAAAPPTPQATALPASRVAEIMPPLSYARSPLTVRAETIGLPASKTQQDLSTILSAAAHADFADVAKTKPVQDSASLSEMQSYVANKYAGVTPAGSINVGAQTFDCIPIRQQPSLRTIAESIDLPPSANEAPAGQTVLGLKSVSCAAGQIPMKRTPLQTITNFETLRDFLAKDRGVSRRSTRHAYKLEVPGKNAPPDEGPAASSDGYVHRHAVIYQDAKINGLSASLNIWSPAVSGSDMSLSQSWIIGGAGDQTESLESGWQVSSFWQTALSVPFIYSTQDNYGNTGCYDLDCAGFVQTTPQVIFAEFSADRYSKINGRQSAMTVRWLRKTDSGNWWLMMNGVWIGYYPSKLYAGGALGTAAPDVTLEFGGENTGLAPSVQMGSGAFAAAGYRKAAFQAQLSFVDASGKSANVAGAPIIESPGCYTLQTKGLPRPLGTRGSYFYFGGPGNSDPGCARATPGS